MSDFLKQVHIAQQNIDDVSQQLNAMTRHIDGIRQAIRDATSNQTTS